MTAQQAYEQIHAYFSRPDAVLARTATGACFYRTMDGNACAAGCLFPDELYNAPAAESALTKGGAPARTIGDQIENWSFHSVPDLDPRIYDHFSPADDPILIQFIDAAQGAHDSSDTQTVAQFLDRLNDVAERYGLNVLAAA